MSGGLGTWWRTRTLREQRLLLVMAALLLAVLAWLAVIRPLADARAAAEARHDHAVVALGLARAQAEAIAAAAASPAAVDAPLDTMIANAAAEAGLPVTRVDRAGPSQAIALLPNVRPQAFFAWLAKLESRGLRVERLSLTPAGPQSLAGQVTFAVRAS